MDIGLVTVCYSKRIYGDHVPEKFDWGKMVEKYRAEFTRADFLKLAGEIRAMGYESLEIWEPNFSYRVYTVQDAADMAATLRQMGFKTLAYCVGSFPKDEPKEVQKCYEFASAMGVKVVVGCLLSEGTEELLEEMERCGKLYDIRYAIENHPAPNLGDPSEIRRVTDKYKYVGTNMDIDIYYSYTDFDVLDAANILKDKIFHCHIRDSKKGEKKALPAGEGDIPITALLKLLVQWGYRYMVSVEYSSDDLTPGLIKSLTYLKEQVAAIRG